MNPLPLVQRLLPGGIGLSAQRLDPDELAEWLDTLPATKPLETARALVRELATLRRADLALRTRLKLLELLREKTEALLPSIEERLSHATLPLPPALQQGVLGANDLLKALSAAYSGVVGGITRMWYGIGFDKPLRLAITQGLRLNRRRLKLAYRVYARGSRSAWTEMHALYRAARSAGVADATAEGETESPRHIHIKALLLAFAEPARFAPGDLDRVRFYLDRYARLARLEPAGECATPAREACFLIRPGAGHPGQSLAKWRDGDLQPRDLVLHCGALVEHVEQQIAGLEQGKAPASLGLPQLARQPQYQAMLRNLARLWRAPPSRRFHRAHFHPRVDVVVGCAALRRFIAGAAYRRRCQDQPAEAAPRASMTEWTITNESPDGLALRYVGGDASEVQVAEFLGVRPRGGSVIHVCIVRRAESALASLEIGVQVLATGALAASITLPAQHGAAPPIPLEVMFLPRLPGFDNTCGLLARPGQLAPGLEFALEVEGRQWLMRVARRLEKGASGELFALARLGLRPPAGGRAGSGTALAPAISS